MGNDLLYSIIDQHDFEKRRDPAPVGVPKMEDLGQIDEEKKVEDVVQDECKVAVKMAFLGAGQGGGNLAEAFWQNGYRKVAVVNTTTRDMQRLSVPNRHLLKSEGGAGKNPEIGRKAVEEESESIFSLIKNAFKTDVEQILICVGAGGGTGTGAALPLIKLCKDYLKSLGANDVDQKVGVIVTLPTKDESAAVQKNALEVLMPLIEMAEKKELSPLVIVDNARVMQLYGQASVADVWVKANKNIATLFHYFNRLCAEDSDDVLVTCDPQDYKSVLRSGILAFGRTKLEKVEKATDIADAVRENVKKGLLVEGLDIGKATHGAAILLANDANLGKISQESLEGAFGSLNRLMSKDAVLHRGVYKASGDSIFLYTIIAGLGRPEARIQEMKTKAGK